jgi:hypothetical protein
VTDDTRIYVDAAQPATLNDGAGKLTDYGTLQEAVLAWRATLSPEGPGDGQDYWRAGLHGSSDRPTAVRAEAAGLAHEETAPCFIVRDHNMQALAFVYCEDESGRTNHQQAPHTQRAG